MADLRLAGALIFYLVLASSLTTLVIQDKYGTDITETTAMKHIRFELSEIQESNFINFSNEDMELTGYTAISPGWNISSNGAEKVSDTSIGDEISIILTYCKMNQKNEYVNTYFINNVPRGEFTIYLRKPNDYHYFSTVKVEFRNDGIHYTSPYPFYPDIEFSSGSYLNNPIMKITTVLNDVDSTRYMKVYLNDVLVLMSYDVPVSSGLFESSSYYGGIGDAENGFILQKVIGDYSSGDDLTESAYTGLSFITLMFRLLLFNVPETYNGEVIFPLWLNLILIKVPLLILAGFVITIIRGN